MPNFMDMLRAKWAEGKFVCIGLDSEYAKIPSLIKDKYSHREDEAVFEFNQTIFTATEEEVCAYKPNIAFYSMAGTDLRGALHDTCEHIRNLSPDIPLILDAKRADIGNTNVGYVAEAFDEFGADAVTVNPYLGEEAMKPFLDQKDKGIIVLCRTSNPGAGEFQDQKVFFDKGRIGEIRDLMQGKDLPLKSDGSGIEWEVRGNSGWFIPLHQLIALRVARHWNKNGNCALVVGATAPRELAIVRQLVGDMPILVPGIGAQGGNLEETFKAGLTKNKDGLIINASRSVIFASSGEDYAEAARKEVERMNSEIQKFL